MDACAARAEVVHHDLVLVVELVEALGQIHAVAGDHARLALVQRGLEHLGELLQHAHHVLGLGVGQRGIVRRSVAGTGLAQHGACAGVGVHHIGAGLAVEVQRAIPVEVDVLDAVVVQREEHHRAHAHLTGDLVLVCKVGTLLVDDGAGLLDGGVEQVLQVHHAALAGGEGLALEGHHAEGHVLAVLIPVVAHQLQHLEQLAEVQILLVGHHVEGLVEVVGVLAVLGGGEVAGDVERRAVGAQDQRRGHAVGLEVHDLCALILLQQVLFTQLVDDGLHLVVVEGLAGVGVELHAQQVVHALRVLQCHGLEPVEDLEGFRVAVLDLLEPGAALVVERLVVLGLGVEAHVELHHLVHAAVRHGVVVAPALVGGDHLAELGAPVAQMVHAHGVPAEELVELIEGVADHRGGQMADVEALGDVDGGVVQHHGLARAGVVGAVAFALLKHRLHHLFGIGGAVDEEVQIALDRLHPAQIVRLDVGREGIGDHHRALAQGLGQLEAGEGVVAHVGARRNLQRRGDVRGLQAGLAEGALRCGKNFICNGKLEVHVSFHSCLLLLVSFLL